MPEEPAGVRQQTPVELRYEDLTHGIDLSASIEAAFGADALGILTVSGVPGLAERRRALLPLARRFAALPEAVKRKYEHAASFYSFGWSHGKEKLQGRPDTHKGSWYANPLRDRPTEDASLIERFPAFYHPNIWPREDLPELQPAFVDMGRLIVEVCLGSQMCFATELACRSATHSLAPCMCAYVHNSRSALSWPDSAMPTCAPAPRPIRPGASRRSSASRRWPRAGCCTTSP